MVMTGADKGKKGSVMRVFRDSNMIIVEGVRMVGKKKRANIKGAKSQIIEMATPIHASNVMIVDSKTGKHSRVGYKMVSDKKIRITKRSGQEIK